jgi:hypothetical protein
MVYRTKVERLAELLHESGREAVRQRKVYRNNLPILPFCEWVDLPESAREGRRIMARFLLDKRRRDQRELLAAIMA